MTGTFGFGDGEIGKLVGDNMKPVYSTKLVPMVPVTPSADDGAARSQALDLASKGNNDHEDVLRIAEKYRKFLMGEPVLSHRGETIVTGNGSAPSAGVDAGWPLTEEQLALLQEKGRIEVNGAIYYRDYQAYCFD